MQPGLVDNSTPAATQLGGSGKDAAGLSIDTELSNSTSSSSLHPATAGSTNSLPTSQPGSASLQGATARGHSSSISINQSAHRQSFAESLRNSAIPTSPRERKRLPSISNPHVQDLLTNPPSSLKKGSFNFGGREWRDVTIGELVHDGDAQWMNMDDNVEEALKNLNKSSIDTVLIRENAESTKAVSTFDYNDLLAYLLVVIGLTRPEENQIMLYNDLMSKQQMEKPITLREIQPLCHKETLVHLHSTANLSQAVEIMGSGIHMILVTNSKGEDIGFVSQLQLVHFFWNEGSNFPDIERLYQVALRDLGVRSQDVVSMNSDAPLTRALILMHEEGVSSIAVVDNGKHVVGNISTRDVRLLTSSGSVVLLGASCMHFIALSLNEQGVEEGRDAVPVFHVNPYSTLAHTIAKVVATRSRRMWVVESESPSPHPSGSPLLGPQSFISNGLAPQTPGSISPLPSPGIPASAMAGRRISGKLDGVVSLTDILNIFAKHTGLQPMDPSEQRARRRRSSSSAGRPRMDSLRGSFDLPRHGDLSET